MLTWNVDPELIVIGPIHIRWYGFLFSLGFLASFFVLAWIFRKENKTVEQLNKLYIYLIIAVVIGARLGHCLFYRPEYYLAHPLEILKVWQGGLASHGAAAGIIIALLVYARQTAGMSFLWLADRVALLVPLGASFVRVGNFFNSEILGLPSSKPWAVVFVRVDAIPRHPVQLYEAITYLLIFIIMIILYRRHLGATPGRLTGAMLIMLFSMRFILEFFKSVQSTLDSSLPITMGQLLSLPLIAFGLWLVTRKGPVLAQDQ
jgi:phosphatidylglycerol:prolipoprotein diacylglycerol transferase